uniref:tRNA nucleotidyltransferase n=1 Tax=uncultured bacterium contig00005 TaxID=1181497 RepID=A0A806KHQ9_9BACT|nr:tRNA nucleotidyltransferase [uncultured bacterium contig00005]
MTIQIPNDVNGIISALESAGFEAYVVGGCVRDSLLGRGPKDWDVCTDATPEQVKSVFANERVIETGLKHGSVTLLLGDTHYEVTTFRVDGQYSDNRHPDSVAFVRDIKEDLARRDFTCNAIAFNPKTGLVDLFDGARDIEARLIRCVGDPRARFAEDSLRILRALRFAATYGFAIHEDTARAMSECRHLLQNVAKERVADELNKLIMGENIVGLLTEHADVLFEVLPELAPMHGFDQHNPYHIYDVYTHTLVSVERADRDLCVRLAMLLHDIAKPQCFTLGDDGVGHFYGHAPVGAAKSAEILRRLKYANDTTKAVKELVTHHDAVIKVDPRSVKRWLNKLGEERFRQLIAVRRADIAAHSELALPELARFDELEKVLGEVLAAGQCFALKDLAVNGRDLIDAGLASGKWLGKVLDALLRKVIDDELPNEKQALLDYAARWVEDTGE